MFLKSKFLGVALATCVALGISACGSSCESGEAKDEISKKIKDSLSKEYPQFAEQIAKIKVSFDDIITKSKSDDGKRASCAVQKIKLKYDTGDTLVYDNKDSRFEYDARKGDKGLTISTRIGSKMSDMQDDLWAYYTGLGVLINGTRKGACNGTFQDKDKNGEVAMEGNCVGGLRDGIWKWYDNGVFVEQETPYKNGLENGVEKFYYKEGTISTTIDYTDGKENGARRFYYKNGEIGNFVPYKNGVVDGKMFILSSIGDKEWLQKEFGIQNVPTFEGSSSTARYFNYLEISNGNFIVGRTYYETPEGKTEQEIFSQLSEFDEDQRVRLEVIQMDNLMLNYKWFINHYGFFFYKNNEQVGEIRKEDFIPRGFCSQQGGKKCAEMFKALIDKSFAKNRLYSLLNSEEYIDKPQATENSAQSKNNTTQTPQASEQEIQNTNENSSEVPATPNAPSAKEVQNVAQPQSTSEQIKPSFDCAKASTNAEKLVCSDNELANLDNELASTYSKVRNSLDSAGKKQLTSEQKAWLATYNQCADKECVRQKLQERIQILQGKGGTKGK